MDRIVDSGLNPGYHHDRLPQSRATLDNVLGVQHDQPTGPVDTSMPVGTESAPGREEPAKNVLAERIVEYGEVVAKGLEELAAQCKERAKQVRREAREQADQAIKFTDMMRSMSEAMIKGGGSMLGAERSER